MAMATDYGVDKIAVVQSALEQYSIQQAIILELKAELDAENLMTTKEYVKGRKSVCASALAELPDIDSPIKPPIYPRMIDRCQASRQLKKVF